MVEDQGIGEPAITPAPEVSTQEEETLNFDKVTRHPWKPSTELLISVAPRGAGVEQFRTLRSRLSGFRDEAPLKTLLVSSGMPEEGKTFVTANLALSLGRNGDKSVLLIDGDMRRPKLHILLGAPNSPGLSEYLAGTAEPAAIMQRDVHFKSAEAGNAGGVSSLTFIPAGKCGDNASELVANHRIEQLIKTVSPHFDWVLIDASPVLIVADAVDLARAADGVVLVVRAGVTRFEDAQRTQSAFANSRLLGVVLNAAKGVPRKEYYYDY